MARGDRHGLALLGGDGAARLVLRGPHYNSFALLQIAPSESHIAFELAGSRADLIPNLFDIYKDTQSQLLKSRFVLAAALRKPEIAALPSVKKHEPDAIGWLSSELHVGFPGKAEIMEVSFTATDPQEAATLVNGVIKAYQTEVVDAERGERITHMDRLDQICSSKSEELRQSATNSSRPPTNWGHRTRQLFP